MPLCRYADMSRYADMNRHETENQETPDMAKKHSRYENPIWNRLLKSGADMGIPIWNSTHFFRKKYEIRYGADMGLMWQSATPGQAPFERQTIIYSLY